MKRACLPAATAFLAAALIALGAAVPAFCQEAGLFVKTGGGVMYGMAKEFLYNGKHTKSELDWSLQPLPYLETELAVETAIGFTVSFSALIGIPMKTGDITDSDWADFPNQNVLTDFAKLDCYTRKALMFEARTGWKLPSVLGITLEPFASFGLMMFKWSARDGYSQINPPNGAIQKWDGTVINYEQIYWIPGAGLAMEIGLSESSALGISFLFSPYLWGQALDSHKSNGLDFLDTMDGGMMIEPELYVDAALSDYLTLSLSLSYRYIWGLVGKDEVQNTNTKVTYTNLYSGGASFEALSASLSFTLRI